MNTPVNFELAKLLKEKGFDIPCTQLYFDGELKELTLQKVSYDNTLSSRYYIAPTIAEVVMWLYEKHEIWIWVERYSTLFRPYAEEIGDERFGKWEGHKYNSPTEAYEAAIKYVLKNLVP